MSSTLSLPLFPGKNSLSDHGGIMTGDRKSGPIHGSNINYYRNHISWTETLLHLHIIMSISSTPPLFSINSIQGFLSLEQEGSSSKQYGTPLLTSSGLCLESNSRKLFFSFPSNLLLLPESLPLLQNFRTTRYNIML